MSENLLKIKQEVFKKRPVLETIVKTYGKLSLYDYINGWESVQAKPDTLFLNVVEDFCSEIYGQDIANKVKNQLVKRLLVSTTDHHGIWNHPIFVNSSVIFSLAFKPEEFNIVFPTESISLNNSCWAGSFLYHDHDLVLQRQSFFLDKQKMTTVFAAPAISSVDIHRVNEKSQNRFTQLIQEISLHPAESFSRQACWSSYKFWDLVFPSAPKLIYLPLETLVINYLLKAFENPEHLFSKIILTQEGRAKWQEFFPSEQTFLFWGVDQKGKRVELAKLPIHKDELIKLLTAKKIYPASPLCYQILLAAGFACAGGFNQTTTLTEMKDGFVKLLQSLFAPLELINRVKEVCTENFAESSLAFLKMGHGIVQPSAVDLYLTGQDYYPKFKKMAKTLTLEQSLDLAMPDIYSIVVPKAEQDLSLNMAEIENEVLKDLNIESYLT